MSAVVVNRCANKAAARHKDAPAVTKKQLGMM
jgi:hypothetical protein